MKRSMWVRLIAVILIISMLAVPVSAATTDGPSDQSYGLVGVIIDLIRDIVRGIFGNWFGIPDVPTIPSISPATPELNNPTESGAAEPVENEPARSEEQTPEYELNQTPGTEAETESVQPGKTPVTMGNVSMGLNALGTVSNNSRSVTISDNPLVAISDATGVVIPDGKYLIRYNHSTDGSYVTSTVRSGSPWGTTTLIGTTNQSDATAFTFTRQTNGTYTIQAPDGTYLNLQDSNAGNLVSSPNYFTAESQNGNFLFLDTDSNIRINALGADTYDTKYWGGYSDGTVLELYAVTSSEPDAPVVDATDASRDIPVNVLTASADNYQPNNNTEGNPAYVLDSNYSTIWHTRHEDTARDTHWIQFTLSEDYTIDGLRYLPRQSGSNGIITAYEVWVSNDGETWSTVATGTWNADADWKIATFNGQNVKYVRLVATNAASTDSRKFASAAEIRLTGVKVGASEPGRTGTQVVYFPVTMYDYDADTIRAATNQAEVEAGLKEKWMGIYFSGGRPDSTSFTYSTVTESFTNLTWQQVMDGTYYADEACTNAVTVNTVVEGTGEYEVVTVDAGDLWATYGGDETDHWYVTDYKYLNTARELVPVVIQKPSGVDYYVVGYPHINNSYLYIGWYSDGDTFNVYGMTGTVTGYTLTAGGETLATLDGTDLSAQVGVPLYTAGGRTTVTKEYAAWNFWNKKTGDNSNGDLFYTGLVEEELVDDQIVFTVPEGGIFNNDDTVKDIYEFVGLPFVLDLETGIYSFDSDDHGYYFNGAPKSGTGPSEAEMHKLFFDENDPQPMPSGLSVGDGSTNSFMPFDGENVPNAANANYHFGMRADLPFAMTPNGRVKATDDESTPITFTFSGDDDVWVFIDGHLVIDLGGIHNRLDATIDFAANTITYYESNDQDTNNTTGSYNDPSFATTQKLFTDKDGEGIIPMTRDAFALDGDHEMQVFYLERGEGTSNGRIEFNLPMSDTVIVSKNATQSWSQAAEDADKAINAPDPDSWGLELLTAKEQASVNNIDFGFTLYKKTAEEGAQFVPVANTNFYLIGRGVEGTVINSTDAYGHFYLKNGQSAKFITELPTEGVTYYVVEDQVPDGFVAPDFKYAGTAAYNYTYTDTTTSDENSAMSSTVSGSTTNKSAAEIPEQVIPMPEKDDNGNWFNWKVNKSYEVTVKGSIEVQDSIEFQCINFLNADLPNPTAIANEDIIVIDYGLPVHIDPLVNDVFRGDSIEIVAWGDETLTLTEVLDEYGNAVPYGTEDGTSWSGSQELHSGTVALNDVTYTENAHDTFTYTLNKQLTEVEVIHYIIKVTSTSDVVADGNVIDKNTACRYSLAKVYIVPATVMYYEENFSDLVTFTGKGWKNTIETAGHSDYQEPGVVGTTTDSIYGSDVAYLNDSFDSNGTSYFGDTTEGAIRFTYTFTGTGTSIFARTSAETGYMQIKIYAGDSATGNPINIFYRDTYWEDKNGSELDGDTLYNIPVFTDEDLDYGTYTMVVTVAKKGTQGAGPVVEETDKDGNPVWVKRSGNEFYLDGIRIMQPLNLDSDEALVEKAEGAYATDGEANMDTVTLRYKLITDDETGDNEWNFAVLTDTNGSVVTAEDYKTIGPKEEVYLLPGQSVSFAVKYWHPDGYRMHMGMKAPFGTATVQVGQNTIDLNNAADCYYDISGMHVSVVSKTDENGQEYYVATYTFTATESIVSLTNIKVVGNYKFTLIENTDINQ